MEYVIVLLATIIFVFAFLGLFYTAIYLYVTNNTPWPVLDWISEEIKAKVPTTKTKPRRHINIVV